MTFQTPDEYRRYVEEQRAQAVEAQRVAEAALMTRPLPTGDDEAKARQVGGWQKLKVLRFAGLVVD